MSETKPFSKWANQLNRQFSKKDKLKKMLKEWFSISRVHHTAVRMGLIKMTNDKKSW